MNHSYIEELSAEVTIERQADFGIILEKSYTIDFAYDYLSTMPGVEMLHKTLNPIWGENILYFNYFNRPIVIVSAKGASIAANAVERIRRTGCKCLISIGTCGSTDEDIEDGTFLLVTGGVRNEGVTRGYLDLKVPSLADADLTTSVREILTQKGVRTKAGLIFTTDNRYQEDPVELKMLHKRAGVMAVDMETSAVLLIARYHGIRAATIKIITDCAVKDTPGELKGIFDRSKNFVEFVHPRLKKAIEAALIAFRKCGGRC